MSGDHCQSAESVEVEALAHPALGVHDRRVDLVGGEVDELGGEVAEQGLEAKLLLQLAVQALLLA